jgi:hypothetical protein
MESQEYPEFLRYLRAKVAEIGRSDLDLLAADAAEQAFRAPEQALRYLETLRHLLFLESRQAVQLAASQLGAALHGEEPVSDIVMTELIDAVPGAILETTSLLRTLPDRGDFLGVLDDLLRDVRDDVFPPSTTR